MRQEISRLAISLHYAAPEQVFGERTEASDWYAFGTMLYEALTGDVPFTVRDQVALLRQKQEQDPPPLSEWDGLPSDPWEEELAKTRASR